MVELNNVFFDGIEVQLSKFAYT